MAPSYYEARAYPEFRQKYLDKILKKNPSIGMESITYDPHWNLKKKTSQDPYVNYETATMMVTTIPQFFGSGEDQPAYVSDRAFDIYADEEVFLNVLLDHEGFHAKDAKEGIPLFNGERINRHNIQYIDRSLFRYVFEVRANINQYKAAEEKNIINPGHMRKIYSNIHKFTELIQNTQPRNHFEETLIWRALNP